MFLSAILPMILYGIDDEAGRDVMTKRSVVTLQMLTSHFLSGCSLSTLEAESRVKPSQQIVS